MNNSTIIHKERIIWIDQLRAVAMLFVVFGHVAIDKEAIKYIYSFHMPLFFIISGMTHRPNKFNTYIDLIKDKAQKLLLPYLLMNLLMFPVWILNFKIIKVSSTSLVEVFKGIFYANSNIYTAPSNATWFLIILFLVEVVFYGLERFFQHNDRMLVLAAGIMGVAAYAESKDKAGYTGPGHIELVMTAIVFYLIGYMFIKNLDQVKTFMAKRKNYFMTVIILLLVGLYFSDNNARVSFNGNDFGSILYFYIVAISLSVVCILLVMKLPYIKLLTYIGQNTIAYVGFHIPMIRFMERSHPIFKENHLYAIGLAICVYFALIPFIVFINRFLPFIVGKKYRKNRLKA